MLNSTSASGRRGFLGAAAGALLLTRLSAAQALEAPAGKVILTVSGGGASNTNEGAAATFDLAMLQKLPAKTFATKTPWFPQPRKFTGVAVTDLLATIGARCSVLKAVALNDYRVDIPLEDFTEHGAIIAYWVDDKPMAVRDKGPLVIIYPFDDKPSVRTAIFYSRAVWQLCALEVR